VKKRCHAIYEILRLPAPGGGVSSSVVLPVSGVSGGGVSFNSASVTMLPRACPVCGMLQTFVSFSSLTLMEDVGSGGQKFVRRGK